MSAREVDLHRTLVDAMIPAMGDECTLTELRAYAARLLPLIEARIEAATAQAMGDVERLLADARRDALTEAADAIEALGQSPDGEWEWHNQGRSGVTHGVSVGRLILLVRELGL